MKVKFLPQNIEVPITPEKTLLQTALENDVDIYSICKGKLICAECRVKIVDGESNVLPPSKAELNLVGTAWRLDSRRLACQVRCFGDVTVDLTEQVKREESSRKNIRGYKSSKPITESKAVIDTMILTEKPDPNAATDDSRSQQTSGGEERGERPPRAERQGGGGGGEQRRGGRGRRGGKNRGGGGGGGPHPDKK